MSVLSNVRHLALVAGFVLSLLDCRRPPALSAPHEQRQLAEPCRDLDALSGQEAAERRRLLIGRRIRVRGRPMTKSTLERRRDPVRAPVELLISGAAADNEVEVIIDGELIEVHPISLDPTRFGGPQAQSLLTLQVFDLCRVPRPQ